MFLIPEVVAMRRAMDLARSSEGRTFPNPMVGAVILGSDGSIVGEGCHHMCGGPHAEIEALGDAGARTRGATMAVTLEPCSHTGRTGPCAPEIVSAGIARVVVAMVDPNPEVSGTGIEYLRKHGVEVEVGLLREEAESFNWLYLHYLEKGRSHLRLKLAVSMDGRIAAADGGSKWISGPEARREAHLMRAGSDAVLVGAGTLRADDPRLDARDVPVGPSGQPVRITVTSSGRLPTDRRFFDGSARSLVALPKGIKAEKVESLKNAGAEVWELDGTERGVSLETLLIRTAGEGLGSILCEGGSRLATNLLLEGLVDRICMVT
ncbi:bifunctional diaminohydroxyphosphoribosylaminopyrimidine deaminase/5-amino-6-(5-phosphoribosylamino)uracil reductase RibD, partial [Candidatus Fermentibacteria bacterium]|nr:bifunctional diaminohydroxyphosphoribosylaminopyrimidine deaminase/5-amino-6-(5-phosphoribosylamino)uracil reductase RibD [Candidatus Fermentibacteria bacterium]